MAKRLDTPSDFGFRCYKCAANYKRIGEHKCPPEPNPIGFRWSEFWRNPDASISGGSNG